MHRFYTVALALGISMGSAYAEQGNQCLLESQLIDEHMATFDDLDFNVFSNQKWDELHKSHSNDIVVHWPDGRMTKGIEQHIEDLKWMFTFAPDTRIKEHPIKVGQGDWTAVHGIMEGTFTVPMTMPDGKVVQPTGKKFRLTMATMSHWTNGKMDEEYLFWDNQAFFTQLGIAN